MGNFPDHPVIAAMERDGRPGMRPGYICTCHACGGGIWPGEKYYLVGDHAFCEDHSKEALVEVTEYA